MDRASEKRLPLRYVERSLTYLHLSSLQFFVRLANYQRHPRPPKALPFQSLNSPSHHLLGPFPYKTLHRFNSTKQQLCI